MTLDNSPQELAWQNSFVRYLTQEAPAMPEVPPASIYNSNSLPALIQFSQEDWLKVYSALITGADLLYPAEAHNVTYLFTQWWDNYMDICDILADCIANSASVQAALAQWLRDSGQETATGGGRLLPPETLTQNLLPPGWTCDDEHAYGMADAIVRYLDGEFLTVLAQIEIATNQVEALALMVDNTQVTAIAGTALEFGVWLQDTMTEIYDASNTESILLELVCDLYCIIQGQCSLSLDDLAAWAQAGAALELTVSNVLDVLQAMLTFGIGAPPKAVVASAFWMVIQLQRLQAISPISLGLLSIENIILLSSDETDTGYLLCAPCPEPIEPYCYRVTDAQAFGVTINTGRGVFGPGGILVGDPGTGSSAIRIDATYNNATSGTLSQIVVRYSATDLSPVDSALRLYIDNTLLETVSLPSAGTELDITFTLPDVTAGNVRLYFDTGRSTATVSISSVSFTGQREGGNPYPSLECGE